MKCRLRKFISTLLAVVIVFGMIAVVPIKVGAYSIPNESNFVNKLNSLRQSYPNGGTYSGTYYEGGVARAWTCYGYAWQIAYDVFGSTQYTSNGGWSKSTSYGTLYAGDFVRINNDTHSIFITKVTSDKVYFTDANWDYNNGIRWDASYSISELKQKFTYKWHLSGNTLSGTGSHTHNYSTYSYSQTAHPHYKVYKCSCGAEQVRTSETSYLSSCTTCNPPHTHSYTTFAYYGSDHPHYAYYKCSCGAVKANTSETKYDSTCGVCRPFEISVLSDNTAELVAYKGTSANVIVPETVDGYTITSISSLAFGDNEIITSVSVPDTVTKMDTYAFSGCYNLSTIKLSANLTSLNSYTFYHCSNLNNVILPDSITQIGEYVFFGCTNLDTIKFSENLKTIGANAFVDAKFNSITIPSSVTNIYVRALGYYTVYDAEQYENRYYAKSNFTIYGEAKSAAYTYAQDNKFNFVCTNTGDYKYKINDDNTVNITKYTGVDKVVNIPTLIDGYLVKKIDDEAFKNDTDITNVIIANGIVEIGNNTFYGCTNLESVSIPDGMKEIGSQAFRECHSLKDINLPNSITSIGIFSFYNCLSLEEVELPNSLIEINNLFAHCENLTKVKIPNSVTKISGGFQGCKSLTSISIPESVTEISYDTFNDSGIYNDDSNWYNNALYVDNCLICLKSEVNGEYVIKDGTRLIAGYSFWNNYSLESLTMPNTIESICSHAFANCYKLNNFEIPERLEHLGQSAFINCFNLTDLTMYDSITYIGFEAFYNCSNLNKIDLPDNDLYIGICAFDKTGYYNDESNWDNGILYIGNYLVAVKRDLSGECVIRKGTKTIPKQAFNGCDNLTSVIIPDSVSNIDSFAFCNCPNIEKIIILGDFYNIGESCLSTFSEKNGKILTLYIEPNTNIEQYAIDNNINYQYLKHAKDINFYSLPEYITVGKKVQLNYEINPDGCTDNLTWKSSDTSVAVVDDNGVVTGVSNGEATIKLTVGNVSTTCDIKVVQPVQNITLNKNTVSIGAFESVALKATVSPDNAYNQKVIWKSSDSNIATVSEEGNVFGLSKGQTTITAMSADSKDIFDTCVVTVTNSGAIVSDYTNMVSSHNYDNDTDFIWSYTKNGARSLSVTFDKRCSVENNFDFLYVYDGDGNQIGKYTGTALAGKTLEVSGDTIRIKLVTDSTGTDWGFGIVSIESVLFGDVNQDGVISIIDATELQKYLAGLITLTDEQLLLADTDADGSISIKDATEIQKYLAGIVSKLG